MAGRLVEQVNRLIEAGIAGVTEEPRDPRGSAERSRELVRDRLGQLIAERHRLARDLAAMPRTAAYLTQKAEAALREGREDLARATMAEIARLEAGRADIEQAITGFDGDISLLEHAIETLGAPSGHSQKDRLILRTLLAELGKLAATPAKDTMEDRRRPGEER